MSTKRRKFLFSSTPAIIAALILTFCGMLENSLPTDVDGFSFVFLGQKNRMTVGSSSFVMKDEAGAVLFGGTVSKMANLFSKLTITYTNIPDKTPTDTVLFSLPVEGTIMAVFSGNSAIPEATATYATFMELNKPLAAGGACPAAATDYIGRTRPSPVRTRDTMIYGLGRITVGGDSRLSLQTKMVPMTGDFSAAADYVDVMSGFTPSGESAVNTAGATMFFTPSGTVLVKAGDTPEDDAYFLLPVPATETPPTAGEITANGIEYRGWVEFPLPPDAGVGKLAQPIAFRGDGTGLTGGPYTQFGQNEFDTTRVITINRSENAPPGVFDMSLQTREGYTLQNRRIAAMKTGGRIILLGVGDRDGNNDGDFDDPMDWISSFLVEMNP